MFKVQMKTMIKESELENEVMIQANLVFVKILPYWSPQFSLYCPHMMFEFELPGFDECTKKQTWTGHKDIKKK